MHLREVGKWVIDVAVVEIFASSFHLGVAARADESHASGSAIPSALIYGELGGRCLGNSSTLSQTIVDGHWQREAGPCTHDVNSDDLHTLSLSLSLS